MSSDIKNSMRVVGALLSVLALAVPVAEAQHPAINLLDANGDIIDPINDDNAGAPFSTR